MGFHSRHLEIFDNILTIVVYLDLPQYSLRVVTGQLGNWAKSDIGLFNDHIDHGIR